MKNRRIIVNRDRRLELVEEDLPAPRPGEVRLKMLAAGVSFPDVMMREGIHPEARKPPFTPGWDIVGSSCPFSADEEFRKTGAAAPGRFG